MRTLPLLLALSLLSAPALAADKRVYRIDSVIATRKGNTILVQARGAVQSGGWKTARLHVLHSDRSAVTIEFVATPPPPGMAVIAGLVPVEAQATVKGRQPSVRVQAEANEITAQVLH